MSKFKVGGRVRRLPKFRDRGGKVMTVAGFAPDGWLRPHGYTVNGSDTYAEVSPKRFELVQRPVLARDELYMRLINDAKLTHQQALEFIGECPGHAQIRHCLDNQPNTGHIMARLVVWIGKNAAAYREGARRCGWGCL